MTRTIETDYLVIGAGAMGMAFTDALIDHADVHVTLVDRRHAAGGHWNDAYPFVVYKRSALDREKGLDGKVQAEMETFEIECWADTRDASVGISELAMAALDAADLDPEEAQPDGVDPELLKRATVLSVQVWTER